MRLIHLFALAGLCACTNQSGGNQATARGGAAEPGSGAANVAAEAQANQVAPPSSTADSGQQYVDMASAGDLFEIEAANIAMTKSQSAPIREFARMIQNDHRRSASQLSAALHGADSPLRLAPALNPAQQANLEALRRAAGGAFDEEFLRQQVTAHEQALTLVTDYSARGDVQTLRSHAASIAMAIQSHLSRARQLGETR